MENVEERVETRKSKIDDSCVDYLLDHGLFELFFDQKLYEPPKSVLELEAKMAA